MKIMLDCSPKKIREYSERYDYDFWQLRTPLTGYALAGVPYGLDNGCFSKFERNKFIRLCEEAKKNRPKFVCLPDIVGNAKRTVELFHQFKNERYLTHLPLCLVLQDGIGQESIPWGEIEAVFVGGSDSFKISEEAFSACKAAKILNKWVHVGRVNTAERVNQWINIADSIDGSGISKYDHMLEAVLQTIRGDADNQLNLLGDY